MSIDIDKFYEDFIALADRVKALEEASSPQKSRAGALPGVAPTKDQARELLQSGDLEGAGAALGIHRVTVASGHAFDETDGSFNKRLLAHLYGAQAADAETAQPDSEADSMPVISDEPLPGGYQPAETDPNVETAHVEGDTTENPQY